MTVYSVIAYKPSGATYCRGHEMDSWGSDLEVYGFTDPVSAAKEIGKKLHANTLDEREGSWELALLVDGHCYWTDDLQVLEYDGLLDREIDESVLAEVMRLVPPVLAKLKEDDRLAREKKETERVAKLNAEAERQKLDRHAKYLKLKEEFEK